MRFSWLPMRSAARHIIAVDDGDSEEADAVLDEDDKDSSEDEFDHHRQLLTDVIISYFNPAQV